MGRERKGAKRITGRFDRGQSRYAFVHPLELRIISAAGPRKGLAGLEGMVALLNACSKTPASFFGTRLSGAVGGPDANP